MVEEAGKLGCHLQDLTVDRNAGEHADVQGFLLGASEDGSTALLRRAGRAREQTKTATAKAPQRGKDNLYELHYDGSAMDDHVHRACSRAKTARSGKATASPTRPF